MLDILDREQALPPSGLMDALIFQTSSSLRASCNVPLCVRIPHHYNLNCDPKTMGKGRGVGMVGRAGNYDLASLSKAMGEHLIPESENPCHFFASISIAVAWISVPPPVSHRFPSLPLDFWARCSRVHSLS